MLLLWRLLLLLLLMWPPTVAVAVVLVPRDLVAVGTPRYHHRHHPTGSLPHSRVGSSMGRHDGENPELTAAAIRALCVVLRTCINIYFRHTTGAYYLFITIVGLYHLSAGFIGVCNVLGVA
jgi:hypothetical protein